MRVRRPGLVAALLLSVAACSGGGTATHAPTAAPIGGGGAGAASAASGGGGGGAIDAGSILTPDAASSIIGGTLTKLPVPGVGGMSLVSYTNTSGGSVTVLVEPVPANAGSSMMQAAIQAAGAKGEMQTLSGLGDAAGKVVNANDATVVFVKGNTLVVVYAQSAASGGSDLESKLESVAKGIEGNI